MLGSVEMNFNTSYRQVNVESGEISELLDPISTSQTQKGKRCAYGSPLVATIVGGIARIGQACCNHWDCPLCGLKRAAQEYRRIVYGAEELAQQHPLYFITLTCRGRECSIEEAEENYLVWTNRLLTNCRTHATRKGKYWAYVQVTERQKKTRRHPHSHIITTFLPDDAKSTGKRGDNEEYASAWFSRANHTAGLGSQHKISTVGNASAVSRYVAKYLFKDSMQETFPKNWRRIRYSRNYPIPPDAIVQFAKQLGSPADWNEVAKQKTVFEVTDRAFFEMAAKRIHNVVYTGNAT